MAGAVAALVTLGWRSGAGVAFAAASVVGLAQRDVLDGDAGRWVLWAIVLGALVAVFDRARRRAGGRVGGRVGGRTSGEGTAPVLLAVTVFGVWVTVPETQHVVVLLGAALPVAAVSFLRPTRLGVPGAFAAMAVLAWVVEVDGRARDGAVVGGFACVGLMALEPLLREKRERVSGWAAFAVHAALVAWCSRVAGLQDTVPVALGLVVLGYVAAGVVVARMRTGVSAAGT